MNEDEVMIGEEGGDGSYSPAAKPKTKPAPELVPLIYVALTGLNFRANPDEEKEVRIEAGGEVPASVVDASPWLLTDGHVVKQGV